MTNAQIDNANLNGAKLGHKDLGCSWLTDKDSNSAKLYRTSSSHVVLFGSDLLSGECGMLRRRNKVRCLLFDKQ